MIINSYELRYAWFVLVDIIALIAHITNKWHMCMDVWELNWNYAFMYAAYFLWKSSNLIFKCFWNHNMKCENGNGYAWEA